ncbi:MAG: hypothetical protein J0H83_11660 [Candidatus Melainabacteria bacterium]|nr:hypothetical protein [Candidatus Melainabacteria bacterium]
MSRDQEPVDASSQGDQYNQAPDQEETAEQRCERLEADLVRAVEINEDLYNKAVELQERVAELESKVDELEQEAETLAMQLQNSYALGYKKGQADVLSQKTTLDQAPAYQVEQTPRPAVAQDLYQNDSDPSTTSDTEPVVEDQPLQEPHTQTVAQPAGYNDQIYNAVVENRTPINGGDLYSNLSWKNIETVYQYSTVAGRPNTDLYFEPFPKAPKSQSQQETQAIQNKARQTGTNLPPVGKLSQTTPPQDHKPIFASDPIDYDPHTATFDGLDAVPTLEESRAEAPDELDLEKLDIFEGLDDFENLREIKVIEDVVLPEMSSTSNLDQQSQGQASQDSANKSVSEDDLRDLIKLRIQQAQTHGEDAKPSAKITENNLQAQAPHPAGNPNLVSPPETQEHGNQHREPIPTAEMLRPGTRNKFIGGKAHATADGMPQPAGASPGPATGAVSGGQAGNVAPAPKALPPEIRKACMLLGLRQEELTEKNIREAWKAQITQVHPDREGGDHESAIYLNIAKEQLLKWLEDSSPKLGKKFGGAKPEAGKPFNMKGPDNKK